MSTNGYSIKSKEVLRDINLIKNVLILKSKEKLKISLRLTLLTAPTVKHLKSIQYFQRKSILMLNNQNLKVTIILPKIIDFKSCTVSNVWLCFPNVPSVFIPFQSTMPTHKKWRKMQPKRKPLIRVNLSIKLLYGVQSVNMEVISIISSVGFHKTKENVPLPTVNVNALYDNVPIILCKLIKNF